MLDVKEEIYKTVENIVQRYYEDQKTSPQYSAVVVEPSRDKYIVLVNGSKYLVRDGVGISPAPNTPVYICVPNNDWNQAYICAGKANINSGVGDVKDVFQNNVSVLGEDKIARIRCATPEDIQQLQVNFQAGVDAIGNACERKGSPPASSSLEDTVAAIDAIQTGGNYITKEIREDGVYYAEDDGVDAYNVVVVSKDVGQSHTVVFYDKDGSTILKTQVNVPYHGNASCTLLDGTFNNGLYFKGWNPAPNNVTIDLECYPQYGDYIIEATDIHDDWETICANKGAPYPLGAKKILSLNGLTIPSVTFKAQFYHSYTDVTYPAKNCTFAQRMVKVAEGEDGSSSTWLSEYSFTVSNGDGEDSWRDWTWYGNSRAHWSNSGIRGWLNNAVIQILPQCLQNTIKQVNKVSRIYNGTYMDQETLDKIWIPSTRELFTTYDSTQRGKPSINAIETQGINYELAYRRTFWNDYYLTRTENGGESAPIGAFYWNSGVLCYEKRSMHSFNTQSNNGGYQIGFCL